jgi:hypothetical protein
MPETYVARATADKPPEGGRATDPSVRVADLPSARNGAVSEVAPKRLLWTSTEPAARQARFRNLVRATLSKYVTPA